jgi:hypothetical protein
MTSQFTPAKSGIAIDIGAFTVAKLSGNLEVHETSCLCPWCLARWVAEYLGLPQQLEEKPDPVRLGMALLCGTCEAKRRLRNDAGRDSLPFFGPSEEATAWGRIRNQARNWCEVRSLGRWDGRDLRDDKAQMLESFLRGARGRLIVSEEKREKWRWAPPQVRAESVPANASMGYQ